MTFEQLTFPEETQGVLKAIINLANHQLKKQGGKGHLDPYHQVD